MNYFQYATKSYITLAVAMAAYGIASAQNHWNITVEKVGYTSFSAGNSVSTWSYPYPELGLWDPEGEEGWAPYFLISNSYATIVGSGTYTIKARWVTQSGSLAPNPPEKLVLKISSIAGYHAPNGVWNPLLTYNTFSNLSASNGFDDLLTSTTNVEFFQETKLGAHLLTFDGSSGNVETTVPVSASIAISCPQGGAEGFTWITHDVGASVDDREATISRQGAHDEWVDADGKHGDTIWSIPGSSTPGVPVYSHFIPGWTGGWSQYPNYSNWPHSNIEVIWNGLDCNYDFTPEYSFDYSNNGIYLQRLNPFEGGSSTKELKLQLKDLGDGAKADKSYFLHYHKPGDNWRKLTDHLVFREDTYHQRNSPQTGGAFAVQPGGNFTITQSYTDTVTNSDEFNIQGGFNWTITKDVLAMPVAVGYKHVWTRSVASAIGGSSTFTVPPSASTAFIYTIFVQVWDDGLIDKYDEGGLVERDVTSMQHLADNSALRAGVKFYDIAGNLLVQY